MGSPSRRRIDVPSLATSPAVLAFERTYRVRLCRAGRPTAIRLGQRPQGLRVEELLEIFQFGLYQRSQATFDLPIILHDSPLEFRMTLLSSDLVDR